MPQPHATRPRMRLLLLAIAASDYARALEAAGMAYGFAPATFMLRPLDSSGVLAVEREALRRSSGHPASPEELELMKQLKDDSNDDLAV